MSIFDFFSSQGTATPSPDAESGDWMDWYLNREGPAGRFRGSRRPRYGIDYLFNGGGSVRSRPSNLGYDRAGPTQLERVFQDNTVRPGPDLSRDEQLDMLRHLQQAPGVTDRAIRDLTPPGEGVIEPTNPFLPPWFNNNIGEGSFWNARYAPQDNTGVMSAFTANYNPTEVMSAGTDYSPDAKGRWITESPTGNKFFSYMVNKAQEAGFTSPESVDYLEDAIGGGGIPLWGGYLRPTWEDDRYGAKWTIGLGG